MGTNIVNHSLPSSISLSLFGLAVCVRAQGTGHSQNRSFASVFLCLCLNQWLYFKWLELHSIWLQPQASLEGKMGR